MTKDQLIKQAELADSYITGYKKAIEWMIMEMDKETANATVQKDTVSA